MARELVTIDMATGAVDLHDSLDADLRQAAQLFWGAVHTTWLVANGCEPLRDIVLMAGACLGGDAGDIVLHPGNGWRGAKGGDINIEAANMRPQPLVVAIDTSIDGNEPKEST